MGQIVAWGGVGLMALAALSDLARFKIPNALPVALTCLYFLAMALGLVPFSLATLLAAFALFLGGFFLFHFQIVGGGDVKLLAALALWVGAAHLFAFLLLAAVAGGILAFLLLAWRAWAGVFPPLARLAISDPKSGVPYGVALGLAGILATPLSPFFILEG